MSGPVLSSLEYQTKTLGFLTQKDYLLQGTKGSKQIIRKAIWPCQMDTNKTRRLNFNELVMIHFPPNSMQRDHISYWENTDEKTDAGIRKPRGCEKC